jgi:uncharacterized protein YjbI with pentapeptide repeats
MSSIDGTCEKVVDPDNPETWGGDEGDQWYSHKGLIFSDDERDPHNKLLNNDGVWECPHEATGKMDGERRCIFHLPVDEKDDEKVADAFLNVLEKATEQADSTVQERHLQFLAAEFGTLDLRETPPEILAEDAELYLTHTEFDGKVDLSDATFNVSRIDLSGSNFAAHVSFYNNDFAGVADFIDTDFEGQTDFIDVNFKNKSHFVSSKFEEGVLFGDAEFEERANFRDAEFNEKVDFLGAEFNERADFGDADFREGHFYGTKFRSVAIFSDADFGERTNFQFAKFADIADFHSVEFGSGADFRVREFDKTADFSDSKHKRSRFTSTDLTETDFTNASLQDVDFESAILSRANLFDTDLRGAKLSGAVLGDARIDEDTQFLGHPDDESESSQHTVSAIRSKPKCVYDPKYKGDSDETNLDKAKGVYRALEELAGKAAQPRVQSQCFVRRQDLQKDEYKEVMLGRKRNDEREDDEEDEGGPTLEERLIAGARYSRAKVARMTLLYGESPWRIIGGSIGFILFVALLYPLGEWLRPVDDEPISYSRILGGEWDLFLESLYFSTLTFTTLGMGDYEPMGLGQVLATLNTAFGAVLIALLVFVLGRRAAR